MKEHSLSHSVNIMLTPQFYTLKKEKLPVRYLYQAKKIAPSLFDGLVEDIQKYDYLVLSPGAFPFKPNIEGINLPGIFTVRNIPIFRIY